MGWRLVVEWLFGCRQLIWLRTMDFVAGWLMQCWWCCCFCYCRGWCRCFIFRCSRCDHFILMEVDCWVWQCFLKKWWQRRLSQFLKNIRMVRTLFFTNIFLMVSNEFSFLFCYFLGWLLIILLLSGDGDGCGDDDDANAGFFWISPPIPTLFFANFLTFKYT